MKIAYFDCFNGISGDMTMGALIDSGLDFAAWCAEVDRLGLDGYGVSRRKVRRAGMPGTKFDVSVTGGQPHRGLADIKRLIRESGISKEAKSSAMKIFGRLAEAEAAAHGVPAGKVHFHEVGAVDSIIDVVGSAIAFDMMGIERVYSSPLNLGSGTVTFSHGTFPVPAPATAEVVKGIPVYASNIPFELTTPTGAAIITTMADGFCPMPAMTVKAIGYGAGGRELAGTPNVLRVFIGETDEAYDDDTVSIVETNIDDMDPRLFEFVMERLFEAGALDVWLVPIIMKKSRPAATLSVLADADNVNRIVDIIMAETTTFGVRITDARRRKLARSFREVMTAGGAVRVKVGSSGKMALKSVAEYEDAKVAARKSGRPVKEIIREAEDA
ncbi:MAG: nickel pincer cofactor biosynthesis protein LarC [Nitrospirae bacterium]|nr:nickel pincer cofactor biosynthesis protein LarC [Nitrospirota bacterium]